MLCAFDRIEGVAILAAVVILCREILVSGLREFLATPQRFTRQQAREMENNNTNVRSGLSHCRHLGAGLDTLRVDR